MNEEKQNYNPEFFLRKQVESMKSEQLIWDEERAKVDEITDNVGLNIDEKIKDAVTAFRIRGFITSQSCEGHIRGDEKYGASFPWVEVYAPAPTGWKEAKDEKKKELEREWIIKNLEQQQKMMGYLSEFYKDRQTPFDARLTFDRIGAFDGFRVQSFGARMMRLLAPEEQVRKHQLYRKEMNDFTNFLKSREGV